VGQRAGSVGDDVRVACVGLGVTGVEVSDPSHRQTGQVGHGDAAGSGHGDRQGTDRGELVDHDQDTAVRLELLEQFDQGGLGVGQWPIGESLTALVQGDHVVGFAGDVDSAEHLELGRDHPLAGARLGQLDPSLVAGRPAVDEAPAATLREGIQNWAHVPMSGHIRPAIPVTTPL
jgi:hypothetical protein